MTPRPDDPWLIVNAGELLTLAGEGPARGPAQAELGLHPDCALLLGQGRVLELGPERELRQRHPGVRHYDAQRGVVLPGFVDPHTHLVFAGDRAAEWEQRLSGVPYLELLRQGGGIHRTVTATRAASEEQLEVAALRWLELALEHGTTTLEAKSGYGLERETELRLLRVVERLRARSPVQLVSTLLAAHVVPKEFRERREQYLQLVLELAQEAAARGLAEGFDVFCEQEAFTLTETRRLAEGALAAGLRLHLHAEQFSASGAAALGVELGALSVDHLERLDEAGIAALARGATVATLLPGATFHLALTQHAPGRRLVDAGVPVALATDLNPGSSFSPSMPMMLQLACRTLGLSVAEALVAATRNAAHALGRGALTGTLEPGKRGDVIVCGVPDHRWLGYAFGWNPVRAVFIGGRLAHGAPT